MSNVKPVPDGYHTATPHLVVKGAGEALSFYAKALGAEEAFRMPMPDGTIAHAEMRIGDSMIMLADEMPQMGAVSPKTLGGTPVTIMLYVNDVDAWFARATKAGCEAKLPPTDMFWGDRYCKVTDPYGHNWAIATHKEDLTPEEIGKRMAKEFGQA